jgi:hypothetical protein
MNESTKVKINNEFNEIVEGGIKLKEVCPYLWEGQRFPKKLITTCNVYQVSKAIIDMPCDIDERIEIYKKACADCLKYTDLKAHKKNVRKMKKRKKKVKRLFKRINRFKPMRFIFRLIKVAIGLPRKPQEITYMYQMGLGDKPQKYPACPRCKEYVYKDNYCCFCGQRFIRKDIKDE